MVKLSRLTHFNRRLSLLLWLILLSFSVTIAKTGIEQLMVDYLKTPLGVDKEKPRFSWQMTTSDDQRGYRQTAYQIQVVDEGKNQVWDSGKVDSDISLGIAYDGKALQPTTRYTWTVTVWDQDGQRVSNSSWFETGLMNPDLSAWDGASWIGGSDDDWVDYSHYLSVFKVQYGIQLDKASQSTKAAFVFGANDHRLMNKDLNLLGMENQKDQSYIAFELDISGLEEEEQAKLNVYRVGYTPDDQPDQPFKQYPIPASLINEQNKYQRHQFYIESNFGIFEVYLNGREEANKISKSDDPNPSRFGPQGFNLNPYGEGNNFISYPMVADIGFWLPQDQKAQFADLQLRHFRQPSNPVFSENLEQAKNYGGIFKPFLKNNLSISGNAYEVTGAAGGTLITADPTRNGAPMLRTEFAADNQTIQKARLYVTARGIYEMYLNGQRIGEDYFTPGLTQYNKTHLYQTYDVTKLINQGSTNALGAWLSEGWWSGNITYSGEHWNYFGDRQSLLTKLVITYADGSEKVITSNPDDWKLFTDGPIRYGSFFQGEVYDATKEAAVAGWTEPGFNDKTWKPVVEVPLAGTAYINDADNPARRMPPVNYENFELTGKMDDRVQIVKTLTAKSVEEVRPGVFVYDMGQNMVGFPTISIEQGDKGQTITLRYAEVRYPDLPEYKGNIGMVMLENIRAALAQDLYILKGGEEVIQPRFTFHGFRFIEITGIDEALPLDAVKGQVLSSVHDLASSFATSNDLVNRLWENITWSLRGNFLSIPTDTPARNERMGWSGDINVFSRASTYLANALPFLKRHLLGMRDIQREDGRFTDVAPVGGGFGGTLWGSAGIIVAWEAYQQYGDITLLEDHYGAMKRYVEFLDTKIEEDTGILMEGPLGDWLSPENGKNDNTLLWTAYHIYDLEIMSKVANLLGQKEDAAFFQKRYNERKQFFNQTYVDPDTHKTIKSSAITGFGQPQEERISEKGKVIDTQASYAIPLAFDIFNEQYKASAVKHLANAITRKNTDDGGVVRPEYSLMTGFIGTASMGEALSENGRDDLAYRLLQQESYPSWLYPVINGATTIWERLNSYTIEEGFGGNNSMNSFNHYAFGAVASWMYNYCLGIQRDPAQPGFQHFILRPTPDPTGQMTWAKGHYDSMYGRISSEWTQEENKLSYSATVPPNTTARLYLPAKSASAVLEQGKPLTASTGITLVGQENGQLMLDLVSGSYEFTIK